MAGLIFSAYDNPDAPRLSVVTDMTWQWFRDARYQPHRPMPPDPSGVPENYRLSERSTVYDVRMERQKIPADHMSDMGPAGIFPWGRLVPRPIPIMKDFGVLAFENSRDAPKSVPARRIEFGTK